MRIQLLGSLNVCDGPNSRRVAGRQGALLAALALSAPQAVSSGRLLEVVWGSYPPADSANALQQRVSRLRTVLDRGRHNELLVAGAGGYALQVDDGQLDVRVFESLAATGQRELSAGDVRAAEASLRRAVELWRGPALEGFADELWAVGEARRLEELRLAAAVGHAEALMGLGEHASAVTELVELLAAHPLEERLRAQLMLAFYGAGRQGEALMLYEKTRRLLAEDLGVDPGPQLQAVHQQILAQDPELGVRPPSPVRRASGNLPVPRTSTVGREREVDQITHLLGHTGLLTLSGPGGAGKTTLALEAARRYRRPEHGAWWVELAPLSDGDALAPAIARALGMTHGGVGATSVDTAALARALADRELLLVLDNCEHLLEAVTRLVDRLTAEASAVRVLATSREPLGLVGEVVWSVPGLGVPAEDHVDAAQVLAAPAVTLLVQRARAHTPGFVLTDDTARAAATLTRRLDGIPLAIELAAARLRVLSLAEVTDGLDDRFRLLVDHGRATVTRHRTLRAALEWSWELLDEPLRRSWAALSVPADRFDARTASKLLSAVGVQDEALDVITALVERSLLTAETGRAPARYRMLESVRDYGREQLRAQELTDVVHAAHAEVVQRALTSCHSGLTAGRFDVDVETMDTWLDDARAVLWWAHQQGDVSRVQRVAGLLGWLWLLRGLSCEGVTWLDRGLGAPDQADPGRDDEAALFWASALRATGLSCDGQPWGDLAVQAASDPVRRVLALVCAAGHHANAGRLAAAGQILDGCAAEAEAVGGWPHGFHRLIRGQVAAVNGDVTSARCLAEHAVRLLSEAGADWAHVHALEGLIEDAKLCGDFTRARDLALDGLRICQRRGYPELECAMLGHAATAAHELGDTDEGARSADRAVACAAGTGSIGARAYAHLGAGTLARHRGDVVTAREHLEVTVDLLTEARNQVDLPRAHAQLAHTAALAGDTGTAVTHARAAVTLARRLEDVGTLALAIRALAEAVAITANPELAVALLTAATAVREWSGVPAVPSEHSDIQRVTELLVDRLGRAAFDQAWTAAQAAVDDLPHTDLLQLLDAQAAAAEV